MFFYAWRVLCFFQDYVTWSFFQTHVKIAHHFRWLINSIFSTTGFNTIFVSSAYFKSVSTLSNWILRSFRKTLNKKGPLKDPWVVPLLTSFHSPTKLLLYLFQKRLSERTANGNCRTEIVRPKGNCGFWILMIKNQLSYKLVNDAGSI